MSDDIQDGAQEYLRYLFGHPTRRQRLRSFLRSHLHRRCKTIDLRPGDQIRLQDDQTYTIRSVTQPTTITVTRFGRSVRHD